MTLRLPLLLLAAFGCAAALGDSVPNADEKKTPPRQGPETSDPVGYVDGTVFETSVDLRGFHGVRPH